MEAVVLTVILAVADSVIEAVTVMLPLRVGEAVPDRVAVSL